MIYVPAPDARATTPAPARKGLNGRYRAVIHNVVEMSGPQLSVRATIDIEGTKLTGTGAFDNRTCAITGTIDESGNVPQMVLDCSTFAGGSWKWPVTIILKGKFSHSTDVDDVVGDMTFTSRSFGTTKTGGVTWVRING